MGDVLDFILDPDPFNIFSGDGAGGGDVAAGQASSAQQAEFSRRLFNLTSGLRQGGVGQLEDFLVGGTPQFLVGPIQQQEQALGQEKAAILNTGVKGGQLRDALLNVVLQRGLGRDALRSEAFNTAVGLGFGQAPIAIQGLGQAARTSSQLGLGLASQEQQRREATKGGLGSLVGTAAFFGTGGFGNNA